MRLIIAGSRSFNDYDVLCEKMNKLNKSDITIISGGARGADKLGERYAKEHNFKLEIFPADWNKHGKSAGYKRNAEMADNADSLLAFWDGESKGTKHMIDLARKKGFNIMICKIE